MKKMIYVIVVTLLSIVTLTACNSNKIREDNKRAKERNQQSNSVQETDASKFKSEYEKLNGTKSKNGKNIRKLDIDKENPFVYKTPNDIISMMNNKESFVVYFGFPSCPWCRSILPSLISVAKDYDVSKIYYVNIYDIRDTKEIDETGKIITTKEGTKEYNILLEKFKNVLSDYVLINEKNKEVKTGEKRIFSPNIIAVVNGKAKKITTGISDKQDDGYMELTEEMKNDMYKSIEKVIKVYSKENAACDKKSSDC